MIASVDASPVAGSNEKQNLFWMRFPNTSEIERKTCCVSIIQCMDCEKEL